MSDQIFEKKKMNYFKNTNKKNKLKKNKLNYIK